MSYISTILTQLQTLGFANPANNSIFYQIAQGLGQTLDNVITEFTNTQNSILTTINTQRYGKPGYYVGVALAFQDGYDLTPAPAPDLDPTYVTIDTTAQIIKQAAFLSASDGTLSLKIAGQNSVSGSLIQLTAQQQSDFAAYFVNFEIPGLPVDIVCLPANIFSFFAICTYNAGYNLSNLQANLTSALIAFQTNFNTGNFDGTLFSDALSSYIEQNVPGINDFFVYNTTVDGAAFTGFTTLTAGYFNYLAIILSTITSQIQFNAVNA